MSNSVHWITARIAEVRKRHDSVNKAVASRLEEMLKGQLSERQLSPVELKHIANTLIADMAAPATPKDEAKQ